jgi:anaerobic selenocysteine-containing dehydrogenase
MADRRRFLQLVGGSTAAAVVFSGCKPPAAELTLQSRARLPEDLTEAHDAWYATACRGCSAGCGSIVRVVAGRAKKLEGNPDHPLNLGRSCARAQAVVQEQYHPDRLTGPRLRIGERGSDAFVPISWQEGFERLTAALRDILQGGSGDDLVLITRPQSAHQALVLERFAAATGAAWLRLEPLPQAAVAEAARRVFGAERLPLFDLQNARSVLCFGADFLGGWYSQVHYGVQYGVFRQGSYHTDRLQPRFEGGRPRGTLVQVEPRFSTTAASADEWVWVRPGREGLLALSLAQVILAEGLADPAGAQALGPPERLAAYAPEHVAAETGVEAERIRRLARAFASQRPSLALGGGPAAAQTNGTDSLSAVFALNLLVGAVGRPGGVLLNPAPPLDLPAQPAPSSQADWQALVERLRAGQVRAVLLHDANPLHGLPAAIDVGPALAQAPLIVSFSSFLDETAALADLLLPSHLPLEAWGDAVPEPAPGEAVLTMQQPLVEPLLDTRAFMDVLLAAAAELGGPLAEALPWPTFKELLRDGARQLLGGQRGDAPGGLPFEQFWVDLLRRGWWGSLNPAASGAVPPAITLDGAAEPSFSGSEQEYPLHLVVFPHNSLGDGRGAHLPWLQAAPDPLTSVAWQSWVEVGPRLAARLGLREGDLVAVETPHGRLEAPVYVNPAASPEVISLPAGQGHHGSGRWAAGQGVNPLAILAPLADRATGALAYAATRARLVPSGRSTRLPKLEGTVLARQLEDEPVLKVTRG